MDASAPPTKRSSRRPRRRSVEEQQIKTRQDLAQAAGVSPRQIGHWELKGLVEVGSPPYSKDLVKQLRFIHLLVDPDKGYGISIERAKEMLDDLDRFTYGPDFGSSLDVSFSEPLAMLRDLFWNFGLGAWLTRRMVLLGFLHPNIPFPWAYGEEKLFEPPSSSAGGENGTPHGTDEEVLYENSLQPYSEMVTATAEAAAVLALYRYFRQAYWEHRDDRTTFRHSIERLHDLVERLALLAIREETTPTQQSCIDLQQYPGSQLGTTESEGVVTAKTLHDNLLKLLSGEVPGRSWHGDEAPDFLRALVDGADEVRLRETGRTVSRAYDRIREWANQLPGSERPTYENVPRPARESSIEDLLKRFAPSN